MLLATTNKPWDLDEVNLLMWLEKPPLLLRLEKPSLVYRGAIVGSGRPEKRLYVGLPQLHGALWVGQALRRRLEKRLYVGLPLLPARRIILQRLLQGVALTDDVDLNAIAEASDGYSGADLQVIPV